MYAASCSGITCTTGLSIAGLPANPAACTTCVSNLPVLRRCSTVGVHTKPGQPSPGMKITGRPEPETSTVNAVGGAPVAELQAVTIAIARTTSQRMYGGVYCAGSTSASNAPGSTPP